MDIFQRDRTGEQIFTTDPEHEKIKDIIIESQKIIAKMNSSYQSPEETRDLLSKLTDSKIDESVWLIPPFYTDFGRNIKLGKGVFINHACTFMDRGTITIEDDVYIAPKVNLITTNHPVNPHQRKSTISKPIVIKRNVWIGINATVLADVTIGENSIVSAGAVVTKDVPPNVIVAGVPAKIIRQINLDEQSV